MNNAILLLISALTLVNVNANAEIKPSEAAPMFESTELIVELIRHGIRAPIKKIFDFQKDWSE